VKSQRSEGWPKRPAAGALGISKLGMLLAGWLGGLPWAPAGKGGRAVDARGTPPSPPLGAVGWEEGGHCG